MTAYDRLASSVARMSGRPAAFLIAVGAVVAWSLSGPLFNFSDTWQLVINTSTTIVTFLMVFVIQSSQNRDGLAIQAKLDELIHAIDGARDDLERLEDRPAQEIEEVRRGASSPPTQP